MEEGINTISHSEIISFKNFIQNNFGEQKIQTYIIPLIYIEKLPREILSKFFVRMYTEETSLYYLMNQSLMRKENTYDTFVKVMYEGLSINSLHHSEDDILYRGSKMSKNEIDNIRKSFEEWNKNNNKLPKFLLYSRTFLSFTKEKERIKNFLKNNNNNCYRVVFILKNNKEINNKYSSNADIENLSVLEIEKEVLFFPYTTFCLKNIFEGEYDNKHCFYIELDYLGKYEYIFDEFKNDENFQYDVINSIYFYLNSYAKEVINRGLLPLNNIDQINPEDNNENKSDNEIENNSEEEENKIKLSTLVYQKFNEFNKRISNKKKVISNEMMKIEPH